MDLNFVQVENKAKLKICEFPIKSSKIFKLKPKLFKDSDKKATKETRTKYSSEYTDKILVSQINKNCLLVGKKRVNPEKTNFVGIKIDGKMHLFECEKYVMRYENLKDSLHKLKHKFVKRDDCQDSDESERKYDSDDVFFDQEYTEEFEKEHEIEKKRRNMPKEVILPFENFESDYRVEEKEDSNANIYQVYNLIPKFSKSKDIYQIYSMELFPENLFDEKDLAAMKKKLQETKSSQPLILTIFEKYLEISSKEKHLSESENEESEDEKTRKKLKKNYESSDESEDSSEASNSEFEKYEKYEKGGKFFLKEKNFDLFCRHLLLIESFFKLLKNFHLLKNIKSKYDLADKCELGNKVSEYFLDFSEVLKRNFKVKEFIFNEKSKMKIEFHLAVFCLLLSDFKVNLKDFIKEANFTIQEGQNLFKVVGCRIQNDQAKLHSFPKV